MARTRPPAKEATAICRRLNHFVHQRYGSWSAFETRFGIPRTTRLGWSRRKNPSVPDVSILLRLAREAQLSLNWLLLGEPPELRVRAAEHPVDQLYAVIEAELRASEKVSPVDFAFAWTQIKAHSDVANRHNDTIVGLAVDGVRPVFQKMVQWARQQDAFAKLWQEVTDQRNRTEPKKEKEREKK